MQGGGGGWVADKRDGRTKALVGDGVCELSYQEEGTSLLRAPNRGLAQITPACTGIVAHRHALHT